MRTDTTAAGRPLTLTQEPLTLTQEPLTQEPTDPAAAGGAGGGPLPGDSGRFPGDSQAIQPGDFNPEDPAHLATFAAELSARMGVEFTPHNLADCYPCLWSNGRELTGEWVSVQFLSPHTFNTFGRLGGRTFDRSGRYYNVGPVALAWVVSRVLAHDTKPAPADTTATAAG